MTATAAYLQRGDLGLRLERVRLIGIGAQDEWKPTAAAEQDPLTLPDVTAAAEWIASRLVPAGSSAGAHLSVLCLDADGSLCSWLTSTSTQPEVVGVLARQSGATADAASGSERPLSPLAFYAATPAEAGVQALEASAPAVVTAVKTDKPAAAQPATDRIAVLATSDAAVRLLIDELDRLQITVGSIVSLWQAMAAAWDPAAPAASASPFPGLAGRGSADIVAADDRTCTAVVLADPRGRLHWCWSAAGRLLAAGTIRVRVGLPPSKEAGTEIVELDGAAEPAPELPAVVVGPEDAARLTAQWLAWGVQLGRAPSRIISVMAETDLAAQDDARAFGRHLGESWPGTPVDMAMVPDPIAATLGKLVERARAAPQPVPDREQLGSLTHRPTRAHRRFYVWSTAAVIVAAAVLGVAAWRLQRAAGVLNASTEALKVKSRALVEEFDKEALLDPLGIESALDTRISTLKREFAPVEQREMPILRELDTLSHVVGIPGLHVRDISLTPSIATLTVSADLKIIDDLLPALNAISGSSVTGWSLNSTPRLGSDSTKYETSFVAQWVKPTRTAGGAP